MLQTLLLWPYLQLLQFLPDLDEAQVQLPSEVVGQATVIVVETQIGRAHLTYPQLLLLEARGWHGISVFFLRGGENTNTYLRCTEKVFIIHYSRVQKNATCVWAEMLLLTSASFFLIRTFSTSCRTFWASSTLPSAPSCSAFASSFPISSFSS